MPPFNSRAANLIKNHGALFNGQDLTGHTLWSLKSLFFFSDIRRRAPLPTPPATLWCPNPTIESNQLAPEA